MKSIKITVTGNQTVVTQTAVPVSGTVGLPVEFSFDDAWAGLNKTAVFRANGKTMDVLNVTSFATVPWELLKTPGCRLWAGVYGTNPDGSLQIPTVWADLGVIQPGADPSGDESADPTLPVWEQLNAVKPYVVKLVYAYDEGSGEMIPSIADSFGFNWDDMVAAVKSNRPVMCYLSGVEGSDDVVDASAFKLTYIEYANEFAVFSSLAEVGAEHITITSDGACSRKFIDFVTSDDIGKGIVKTVNGIAPDGKGNVEIETGGDTETAFDFDETYVITEEEIVNGAYARTTDSRGDPISLSEMQVDFTTPAGSNTGICYLYFRYTSNGTPVNMRVSEFPYQHAEKVRRARTICYKVRDSFYKIEGYMWNEDDSYTALQHTNGARMNCGVFFDNPTPLNGFHFNVANGSPVAGTEIRVRGRKA